MPTADDVSLVRVAAVLAAIIITLGAVIALWHGLSGWIAQRQRPSLALAYFPLAAINLWYQVAEPPAPAASRRLRPVELVLLAPFLCVFLYLCRAHAVALDELLLPLVALLPVVVAGHWSTPQR